MAWAQQLLKFTPTAEQTAEWRSTLQSLLGFVETGDHIELARHGLPNRRQRLVLLAVRKGPPPRCSPRHGSQREHNRIKNLTTSQWPLLTLEHAQANGKPRRIGEGEMCTSPSSDAATTTA